MLTVLEAIKLSTNFLEKKGIESSRLNAELLLAEILGCQRLQLYLSYDRPLSEDETTIYRDYITRRSKNEPLQYIIGHVNFYGYKIFVNEHTLIPRQETEILVETVLQKVKKHDGYKILDIGTGTGCISIALALELPQSNITTIDISREALVQTWQNIKHHQLQQRVKLIHGDIFDDNLISDLGKFDIIISNPPYVSEEEYKTLQKEILKYEPREAVTDSGTGTSFYQKITSISNDLLNKNGLLFFELGESQAEKVSGIMSGEGFSNITIYSDLAGIKRVIQGELV